MYLDSHSHILTLWIRVSPKRPKNYQCSLDNTWFKSKRKPDTKTNICETE